MLKAKFFWLSSCYQYQGLFLSILKSHKKIINQLLIVLIKVLNVLQKQKSELQLQFLSCFLI